MDKDFGKNVESRCWRDIFLDQKIAITNYLIKEESKYNENSTTLYIYPKNNLNDVVNLLLLNVIRLSSTRFMFLRMVMIVIQLNMHLQC